MYVTQCPEGCVEHGLSVSVRGSKGHWGQLKIHHRLDYCWLDRKATPGPAMPQLLQLLGNPCCN